MGKLSLYLVLGFSTIFMILGYNSNLISNRSVENMVDYHNNTVAYNIAVSGANLAANEIFMDENWTNGFSNMPFSDGVMNVSVEIVDVALNIRKIVSTGTYHGLNKSIEVTLQPSNFSKFAYYSASEGGTIWWTTGDTVWGPFHTQDYLRIGGNPVFYGKVTTKQYIVYKTGMTSKPKFLDGFQKGVNLELPKDGLQVLQAEGEDEGLFLSGKDTVYLTFDEDSIKCRYSYKGKDTALYLPNAAPNGVIYTNGATVRLKGTVEGRYTLVCSENSATKKGGSIYLDDNIVLKDNPLTNPKSTDILGIVAQKNVVITNNKANQSNIDIHASIYCESGGFGAEEYKTRPKSGSINLVGGIIQNIRMAVGTFDGNGITSGFSKRYRYDARFMHMYPPFFPNTGEFEIVAWYE